MLRLLRRNRRPTPSQAAPSVGEGRRVYAIGDIHGRLDLFDQLLELIHADTLRRGEAEVHVILLGDLVDRGPDSSGVVDRALELSRLDDLFHFLKGNHEDTFLRAVRGDVQATRFLARFGGLETMRSYGLTDADLESMDLEDLTAWLGRAVPRAHVDFLDGFEDWIVMGDYLFVHAGIRPQVPLDQQDPADLYWIRDEFLDWSESHDGRVVVHGHTITPEIDEHPNRIGIDTGAFTTGRLTAIGLEGTERWYLQTAAAD